MRFLLPLAALADGDVHFDGDPRARERPLSRSSTALRALGIPIDLRQRRAAADGPRPRLADRRERHPRRLAVVAVRHRPAARRAPLRQGHRGPPRRRAGCRPALHIAMTVADAARRRRHRRARGDLRLAGRAGPLTSATRRIEPDLSNAAPFLAAAMVTGGEVTVPDWPLRTTQAGDVLRHLLARLGGRVRATPRA